MIFLTLALICAIATCFHIYLYSKSKIEQLEVKIQDLEEVNDVLHDTVEIQKKSLQKLHSQNKEGHSQIDLLNEKIESLEIFCEKVLAENNQLLEQIEKLSQKELIEECRAFYNALEQRKKDMLAALNSLESSFNAVKRVYSAQTTVNDCVTTIKPVSVPPPTITTASDQTDKWPFESKYSFNPC